MYHLRSGIISHQISISQWELCLKKKKKKWRDWSETSWQRERRLRRQKGLRWQSRGERKRGDSYKRQKASETRESRESDWEGTDVAYGGKTESRQRQSTVRKRICERGSGVEPWLSRNIKVDEEKMGKTNWSDRNHWASPLGITVHLLLEVSLAAVWLNYFFKTPFSHFVP